jgi:hypothetical protein
VNGKTIEMDWPDDRYRIVGFEVVPRSVPYGKACTPESLKLDREVIWPDEPFSFSYSVKLELS